MSEATDDSLDSFIRRAARTPDVDFPRRIDVGVRLAQRFDLECTLGAGGMGQVFRAYDHVRQTRVALKVLGRLSPGAIIQLKREFRTAAGLVHGNVVRLHELFSDGVEWFFTMDWVDGVSLNELPPDTGSALFRSIFCQLGKALLALHRTGMIHSDLKPSNFLISRNDQRVVLIDFGLARPIGMAAGGRAAGTPRYMAPEQATGGVLTEASDWYSFGIVLREALTRKRGQSLNGTARVPLDVEDLEQLCKGLVKLNPRDRPTAPEVLRVLGAPEAETQPAFASLNPRVFVGRERELAALEQAFAESVAGNTAIVIVDGSSGIGKTALIKHFAGLVQHRGGTVLASECRERESMSYKAVDGLMDGILSLLEDLPRAEASALLPESVSDLSVLFPALRSTSLVTELASAAAPGDERAVRTRAIAALGEMLGRLREQGPLMLSVDDLQWGDAESALLLGPALAGQTAVPLLFVGSCRASANGRGPLLETLLSDIASERRPVELTLGPLEPRHAEELALAYLPATLDRNHGVASAICRDAGGHPLFVAELAHSRALLDEGRGSSPPTTLLQLVRERIAGVTIEARTLLEILAVAGIPLSRALLRDVTGIDAATAEAALDVLKAQHLAKSQGLEQHDGVDIHHDRIREIVTTGLAKPVRTRAHLALARVLEAGAHNPEQIALHYQDGGQPTAASRFWLAAADQAGRALAFDHAVVLYDKGLATTDLAAGQLLQLRVRRANALANAGKGLQAAEGYLAAAADEGATEAIELHRLAAEQLILSGHLERGFVAVEAVLRTLGMRSPPSGRSALLSLVWGRLLVRTRGLGYVLRSEAELTREALIRLDAAWCTAAVLGVIDPIRGAAFQTRHLRLALETGEPRRMLRALALEAPYTAAAGVGTELRTRELFTIAEALASATNDPSATGLLCMVRGVANYLHGNVHAAFAELETAIDVLTQRCTGTIWEIVTARRFMIASLFFLGRLRQLNSVVPPLLDDAESRGNLYATMSFRTAYAWAGPLAKGNVEEARGQLQRARDEWQATSFQLSHWNIIVGETYIDLYTGDAEAACTRAAEQRAKVGAAGLARIGIVYVQMWHLSGASAVARAEQQHGLGDAKAADSFCKRALAAVARLTRSGIPRAGPLGLLIRAAVEALRGSAEANACLENAIDGFDREHMALFAAAARSRLGTRLGGSAGRCLADEAERVLESEGVADMERMVDMLAPGFARRPLSET